MTYIKSAAVATTVKSASYLAGAILGLGCAGAASAQVVENATIANSYSYRVGSQQGSDSAAPGNTRLFISDTTGGFQSDLGLALTASLNQGSFSFLHNGYCVGDCTLSITTDVTFTLTNMGTSPVDLRFDSLITPGHLARSSFAIADRSQAGTFNFAVTQDTMQLYGADGLTSENPLLIETSDNRPFNSLQPNDNPTDWTVLNWSATNLNINLATIGAGADLHAHLLLAARHQHLRSELLRHHLVPGLSGRLRRSAGAGRGHGSDCAGHD